MAPNTTNDVCRESWPNKEAVQTAAAARKNPEYCALISLIPPVLTIPRPSFAAKLSGAVALLHVVTRKNRILITRTAVPKMGGMAETFQMRRL